MAGKRKVYVMTGKGGDRYAFTYNELQRARSRFLNVHYGHYGKHWDTVLGKKKRRR